MSDEMTQALNSLAIAEFDRDGWHRKCDTLTTANRQLSERVKELEYEQDQVIGILGPNIGWWGRACVRLVNERNNLQARLAEVERERDWWHGNCAAEKVARQMRESERDTLQRETAELKEQLRLSIVDQAQTEAERNDLERKNQRLREALESIAKNTCCDKCQEAALVAREALHSASPGEEGKHE